MRDLTQEAPSLIGIGAQSIVNRAKSLGLTWTIRPATVTVGGTIDDLEIMYDGDTESIGCINISGITLGVNDRVMAIGVPPSANYVIGPAQKNLGPTGYGSGNWNTFATTGSTTSAFFSDMPGPPRFTMVKANATTKLRLDASCTIVMNTAANNARIGINLIGPVSSFDFTVCGWSSNASTINTHAQVSGHLIVAGLEAGTFTCTLRWARNVGAGTLSQFVNDDWNSFIVQEIP